jgi:hypothetical protein
MHHARKNTSSTATSLPSPSFAALRKFLGLRPHGVQTGSSRTAFCTPWCPDGSSRTALTVLGPCLAASLSHPIRKKNGVPFILASSPGTHAHASLAQPALPKALPTQPPPFCASEVPSRLPPPRTCPSHQQRSISRSPNILRPGHHRCWSRHSLREVNWLFFCAGFEFGQGGGHCSRGSARDGLVGKPLPFCRRYRVGCRGKIGRGMPGRRGFRWEQGAVARTSSALWM